MVVPTHSVSDCMVAVELQFGSWSVLVITLYLPVDYGNPAALDEYNAELVFMEG